jgi:Flp pilus assembly CpaF family ATPase
MTLRLWYSKPDWENQKVLDVRGRHVRIGRNPDNDLVLDSPFVPDEALLLQNYGKKWELVSLGFDIVQVDGRDLGPGERLVIDRSLKFKIYPFDFSLVREDSLSDPATVRDALERRLAELLKNVHLDLLKKMHPEQRRDDQQASDEYLLNLEKNLDELAKLHGLLQPSATTLLNHIAGKSIRGRLLELLIGQRNLSQNSIWAEVHHWSRIASAMPDMEQQSDDTVTFIKNRLVPENEADLTRQIECVEQGFWGQWKLVSPKLSADILRYLALRQLKKDVKDIVFGYGPLEDLLRTPTISEIMVVSRDHIYIEQKGIVENSGRQFISDEVTISIIERIVSKVGRRIDKSKPLVDARLTDGSRVNAVIPPLAVSGPCLTIRKFPDRKLLVEDLIRVGTLTQSVAEFLKAAVLKRCNILISGGTGTGKTTMLNCLSDFIPDKERIVTIEDVAELQLKKEHVVRMETRQENIEGKGEYTIRELVKNALRMRPDRIVVGECRGAEALDMLQAMNTGHDGSLTTVHANTSEDVILRLEVLVQMGVSLPLEAIHRQIGSAIDLIVQMTRLRNGRRVISQITEVVGYDPQEHQLHLKDIFLLANETELRATGRLPTFIGEMIEQKLLTTNMFYL